MALQGIWPGAFQVLTASRPFPPSVIFLDKVALQNSSASTFYKVHPSNINRQNEILQVFCGVTQILADTMDAPMSQSVWIRDLYPNKKANVDRYLLDQPRPKNLRNKLPLRFPIYLLPLNNSSSQSVKTVSRHPRVRENKTSHGGSIGMGLRNQQKMGD